MISATRAGELLAVELDQVERDLADDVFEIFVCWVNEQADGPDAGRNHARQFRRQRRGDVAGGAFEEDETDEARSALKGGGRRVGMVDAADLDLNAHASSFTMLRAAEAGSDAWVIGRPMTR